MNAPQSVVQAVDAMPGTIGVEIRTPDWSLGRDGDRELSSASVIKLFPLAALIADAEAGRRSYDTPVTVSPVAHAGGMGVLRHMGDVPVRLTLWQLAVLMVVASDNTATNVVIDHVGIERINAFAREVGANRTRNERRMFDSEARQRGLDNITTAADLCRLLAAVEDGRLGDAGRVRFRDVLAGQQHHHKLTAQWNRDERLRGRMGHKTGELSDIEHDVLVYDAPAGPVFVAVLLADLTDPAAAQRAHGVLGRAVFDAVPPADA